MRNRVGNVVLSLECSKLLHEECVARWVESESEPERKHLVKNGVLIWSQKAKMFAGERNAQPLDGSAFFYCDCIIWNCIQT